MTSRKLKLKEILDVVLLADAVTKNPGLKFKADAQVAALSHHCKRIIECEIGPEMKKLDEQERPIIEQIKAPFQANIDNLIAAAATEEEIEKESRVANSMILKTISADSSIEIISQNRSLLWEREVEAEYPNVEVEDMEYKDRFPDDVVEVSFMNGMLKITGYNALRSLIARKFVKIL